MQLIYELFPVLLSSSTPARGMIKSNMKKAWQEVIVILMAEIHHFITAGAAAPAMPAAGADLPKPDFSAPDTFPCRSSTTDPRFFASLSPALDAAAPADLATPGTRDVAHSLSGGRASRVTFAGDALPPRERGSTFRGFFRARTSTHTGVIPDLRPAHLVCTDVDYTAYLTDEFFNMLCRVL